MHAFICKGTSMKLLFRIWCVTLKLRTQSVKATLFVFDISICSHDSSFAPSDIDGSLTSTILPICQSFVHLIYATNGKIRSYAAKNCNFLFLSKMVNRGHFFFSCLNRLNLVMLDIASDFVCRNNQELRENQLLITLFASHLHVS